jgi:elongation factor P hydroxylase
MDIFNWLNEWYKSNCNGDWEHGYGIKIETLDNPGWWVRIDLNDTELENKDFEKIAINSDGADWMFCRVENNVFSSSGDPNKLIKILEVFKTWAEKHQE